MSFPITAAGGFGSGALGNVSDPNGQINSYAPVTALTATTVTIDSSKISAGIYDSFSAGTQILFHVCLDVYGSDTALLGKWAVGNITAVDDNVLTVDSDFTTVITNANLANVKAQLVTIPQFKNLTLNSGNSISPLAYNKTDNIGGIIAFKCSGTFYLKGGHVNLADKGFPISSIAYIVLSNLTHEKSGKLDTDKYSGWENYYTRDHLIINSGDGAAFILAKTLSCNSDSRIGNPDTRGVARCRGALDSAGAPANVSNCGGSSILIAANTISNFDAKIIAKYRTKNSGGIGLCRCYIATSTTLPQDEGLYAYDCIHNPDRLTDDNNVKSFGDGSDGVWKNSTAQINNYAKVTAIDSSRQKLTYSNMTTQGLYQIKVGSLVMILPRHKSTSYVRRSGYFLLAKVVSIANSIVTIDPALPSFSDLTLDNYSFQIISVPQFDSFTLTQEYAATPKLANSVGGIFAIAVNGTCDLRGGIINVEGKGNTPAYSTTGLKYISNAQLSHKIPIGNGHGSVFILANNLIMNSDTRIGATYSGASFGGRATTKGLITPGGGWAGNPYSGYDASDYDGTPGSGAGKGSQSDGHDGGFGSNSADGDCQGAHVLIIANKITGFNQAAISTGGAGGSTTNYTKNSYAGSPGGAGYGGGGGSFSSGRFGAGGGICGGGGGASGKKDSNNYIGGGGASGFAFVYCNLAVNQDTTNTAVD